MEDKAQTTSSHSQGQPECDDLVLTIHMLQGEEVVDTSTAAIAEQGKRALRDFLARYHRPNEPYPQPPHPFNLSPPGPKLPVCIVGAGVCGLYVGLILESLGIEFDIMEGSSRVGGRLRTHRFPKNQGRYQYYGEPLPS